MSELLGRVYSGCRLVRPVVTTDHEITFQAERVRDGEPLWVRTVQEDLDPSVVAFYARHYEAEIEAARRLASSGAVVHVREVITVGDDLDAVGRPAVTTDIPRGRALDTILAESLQPRPLKEVLRWFRRLIGVVESAHGEGLGHGQLHARQVFVDETRVFVVGFVAPGADDLVTLAPDAEPIDVAELLRRDVRALASILYHATTGRPPAAGFPYTGQPAAPHDLVEGYPESLSRFLLHRLSPDGEDPVADAAVFRRGLESLAMDPEFRRAASFDPDEDHPLFAVARRERWWRRTTGSMVSAAVGAVVAGALVFGVTRVRINGLERRLAAQPDAASLAPTPAAILPTGRAAVWACIHQEFQTGGDGQLDVAEAQRCASRAPGLSVDELTDELTAIQRGFVAQAPPTADDTTFAQLFRLGADEVEAHVRYRLEGGMPTTALDEWIARNLPSVRPTLRQLEARGGAVGAWARVRLELAGDAAADPSTTAAFAGG